MEKRHNRENKKEILRRKKKENYQEKTDINIDIIQFSKELYDKNIYLPRIGYKKQCSMLKDMHKKLFEDINKLIRKKKGG